MVGIRGDIRPRSSYQDRPAVEAVLGEEFPAPVLELADQGRYHDSTLAAGERLTPLMRVGIVKKQGQPFPVAFWTVSFDFLQLGAAIPDFAYCDSSLELNRVGRA